MSLVDSHESAGECYQENGDNESRNQSNATTLFADRITHLQDSIAGNVDRPSRLSVYSRPGVLGIKHDSNIENLTLEAFPVGLGESFFEGDFANKQT